MALAYGVKGVFFHTRASGVQAAGFVDADGQPTPQGQEIARLAARIEKLGPTLMRLKRGKNIASADGNALATTLVSPGGARFVYVVNLDLVKAAAVRVRLEMAEGTACSGAYDLLAGQSAAVASGPGGLGFTVHLEPGDGRLFQLRD